MKSIYTIIRPVVTEKATKLGEKMKYLFYINRKATKIDIKHAIKEMYGLEVKDVRIIQLPSKQRMAGKKIIGKRPEIKKAIVTLKGKKKMDMAKLVKNTAKK